MIVYDSGKVRIITIPDGFVVVMHEACMNRVSWCPMIVPREYRTIDAAMDRASMLNAWLDVRI